MDKDISACLKKALYTFSWIGFKLLDTNPVVISRLARTLCEYCLRVVASWSFADYDLKYRRLTFSTSGEAKSRPIQTARRTHLAWKYVRAFKHFMLIEV